MPNTETGISINNEQIDKLIDLMYSICQGPKEAYCLLIATLVYMSEEPEFANADSGPMSREELAKTVTKSILNMQTGVVQ